jgi:hypothetical protein
LLSSGFFEYNNGYAAADSIKPGEGYWVKAKLEGAILLHSTEKKHSTPQKNIH